MQTTTMFTGDVLFTNFDYDTTCLSKIRDKWEKTPTFTLNFKQTFGERPYAMFNWMTLLTEERVNTGEMAHFEVMLTNGARELVLGYFEPSRTCPENYLQKSFKDGENKKCSKSVLIYSGTKCIRFRPNDTVGLFIDLREPENGCIYLTHMGRLAGLMYSKIQSHVRPGISICSEQFNYFSAKAHIKVYRSQNPPIGFDNIILRQKIPRGRETNNGELLEEYLKGLGQRPLDDNELMHYNYGHFSTRRTPKEMIYHLICKVFGLYSNNDQ